MRLSWHGPNGNHQMNCNVGLCAPLICTPVSMDYESKSMVYKLCAQICNLSCFAFYNKCNFIVVNVNYKIQTYGNLLLLKCTMNCGFGMREEERKITWFVLRGRPAISLPPAGRGFFQSH